MINWIMIGGVIWTIFFMSDSEKKDKIVGSIWIIILIILWIFYPLVPGNIFIGMWTAIIWSIIVDVLTIYLLILKRKR